MKQWTDTLKAEWILANGEPKITWIYERVGNIIYQRPGYHSKNIPPWVSMDREQIEIFKHTRHNND